MLLLLVRSIIILVVKSCLLWDGLGGLGAHWLAGAVVLIIDQLLVIFVAKDLIACTHTLSLRLVGRSHIASIHPALSALLLILHLLVVVFFRPSEPAWVMPILHGLLIRTTSIISCHKFGSRCGCHFFVNL